MNKLYFFIVFCIFVSSGNAQIIDVFQNKNYDYATYLSEFKSDKEYAPSKIEVLQDKNKTENKNWINIEKQLVEIANQQIENEISFFLLQTKANSYKKQIDLLKKIQEPSHEVSKTHPSFKNISIKLIDVVNNHGIYTIDYGFDDFLVKNLYLANFDTNKIIEIKKKQNLKQQEKLSKLTLAKLTATYLLQTKKLDLGNVNRIESIRNGKEKPIDFSKEIDYSEAIVYPYFSGLMVEFPANSISSKIFNNNAFRIFIKNYELNELLALYPEYTPVFKQQLKIPSSELIQVLNDDENFNLYKYNRAPKELDLINDLIINSNNKKPFSLTVHNFYLSDTVKKNMGSKKFFLNKNGDLIKIEERNNTNDVVTEEKHEFNEEKMLSNIQFIGNENKLRLFNYKNNLLSSIENIDINDYKNAYGTEYRKLEIYEQLFVYNNIYRYRIDFNTIGDLNRNNKTQIRFISDNRYCTEDFCFILNDNKQIIGVKTNKGDQIDLLTNTSNKPLETYMDNNRLIYVFSYDNENRIKNFTYISDDNKATYIEYQFHEKQDKPLTIIENQISNSKSTLIQEYEITYWDN